MTSKKLTIFHNARCSKSRSACALIAERGLVPEVVDYLETPPTREQLEALLTKLAMRPGDLIRKGEPVFQATYGDRVLTDAEALEALLAHPILMERPIVVCGDRAVVARPVEKLLDLL